MVTPLMTTAADFSLHGTGDISGYYCSMHIANDRLASYYFVRGSNNKHHQPMHPLYVTIG